MEPSPATEINHAIALPWRVPRYLAAPYPYMILLCSSGLFRNAQVQFSVSLLSRTAPLPPTQVQKNDEFFIKWSTRSAKSGNIDHSGDRKAVKLTKQSRGNVWREDPSTAIIRRCISAIDESDYEDAL
jgi:hypothetical protein